MLIICGVRIYECHTLNRKSPPPSIHQSFHTVVSSTPVDLSDCLENFSILITSLQPCRFGNHKMDVYTEGIKLTAQAAMEKSHL